MNRHIRWRGFNWINVCWCFCAYLNTQTSKQCTYMFRMCNSFDLNIILFYWITFYTVVPVFVKFVFLVNLLKNSMCLAVWSIWYSFLDRLIGNYCMLIRIKFCYFLVVNRIFVVASHRICICNRVFLRFSSQSLIICYFSRNSLPEDISGSTLDNIPNKSIQRKENKRKSNPASANCIWHFSGDELKIHNNITDNNQRIYYTNAILWIRIKLT